MVKNWIGTVLCVLASFTISSSMAGALATLDHMPLDGIHVFDRVDLNWSLDSSDIDSVSVHFGDDSFQTVPGDVNTIRHHYNREGSFDVTIAVWSDGQPSEEFYPDLIQVRPRSIAGLNVMFLHHSTGRLLIKDSGFRSLIDWHNEISGSDIRFWDHDYAYGNDHTGVILPDSTVHLDWIYGNEANNIQPDGYHDIFCGAPAFRDSLFNRHEVIIFKNDHRTGDIESAAMLAEYKAQYLEIRDVLDEFPEKLFIMVSGSSRRPENITVQESDRAREFYNWVQSPEFMNGHPNIAFFDLFDELSSQDNQSNPHRNMLRPDYRRSDLWDDHPNELANLTIGPQFADFLLRTLDPDFFNPTSAAPMPTLPGLNLNEAVPNPFNPATRISWELDQPALVNLRVYDLSGRLVQTLVNAQLQAAGPQETVWRGLDDQGRAQPSGIYFYRLEAGGLSATKRMTLIR